MNNEKLKSLNIKSCLDIGSNIGQFYSIITDAHPGIYVELVEPNPWAAGKLRKRLKHNIVHNCGAGSVNAVMPFHLNKYKRFSKGASFREDFQSVETETMQIEVKTVDSLSEGKSFDLIKIDTEGFEFEVLKGAEESIKLAKYLLIEMEYNKELIDWLRERNYYATDTLGISPPNSAKLLLDILFEVGCPEKEIKTEDFYANSRRHLEEH